MRIAVGSDHAGFPLKQQVVELLRTMGHEAVDLGTKDTQSVDYPDYALAVAESVVRGQCERGVLVCGTGIGMSIAANKVPGIRAALCWDEETAGLSREHNDANVLCLPGRSLDPARLPALVDRWMKTAFGGGRHAGRVGKIAEVEKPRAPRTGSGACASDRPASG